MKSKFLFQDVDVVSFADKGIVVRCFVCRNYDKVLMETGKLPLSRMLHDILDDDHIQ